MTFDDSLLVTLSFEGVNAVPSMWCFHVSSVESSYLGDLTSVLDCIPVTSDIESHVLQ